MDDETYSIICNVTKYFFASVSEGLHLQSSVESLCFLPVDDVPDLFFQVSHLQRNIFTAYAWSIWISFRRTYVLSLNKWKNSQDMEYPDASLDNRLSWVFT